MAELSDPLRLAALDETGLVDRPPIDALERYAAIAKTALDVPVALVSLVDDHRQFFTSQCGLPEPVASARQTLLSHSFCQYVVIDDNPLVITDARLDPRLATNLAIRDLSVIAYAGMPIRTSDGYVLGSFCALDTKPKRWSERDLSVLRELALAVGAEIDTQRRAVRAERSQQKLEDVVDSLETMQTQQKLSARQATHDLRTPLQVITMGLEGLRNFITPTTPAAAVRILDTIDRNARHAAELVTALHDMGNIPDAAEQVELAGLVALVCADLQLRDRATRIELVGPESANLRVVGTARELQRCVENLVTNAQRFARSRIAVRFRSFPGNVELVVEDDGPGLPKAEDYERAFTSRTRFHLAEGKSGTGLGLASVRAMIEWCGGQVIARPSALGGAAFGFSLPLALTPG